MFYFGFFFVLCLIIFIHELGHFLAAKCFGVSVETFSIGFGPKIFNFKKGSTNYKLSIVPLGGYVKMKAENITDIDKPTKDGFYFQTWWKKAIIALSGPLFNLFFAFIILVFAGTLSYTFLDYKPIIGKTVFSTIFHPNDSIVELNDVKINKWSDLTKNSFNDKINIIKFYRGDALFTSKIYDIINKQVWNNKILPRISNTIGSVSIGLPAYKAGLREGDIITTINSIKINNWYDIKENLQNSEKVKITFLRNSKSNTISISSIKNPIEKNKYIIGIQPKMDFFVRNGNSFFVSVKNAILSSYLMIKTNLYFLFSALKTPSNLTNSIAGPILIGESAKDISKFGVYQTLLFIAFVNIILMVVNLLPIPLLDGGQILFNIYEGIFGKQLPKNIQLISQKVGLIILFSLMIFAFYSDISKLYSRISSTKAILEK